MELAPEVIWGRLDIDSHWREDVVDDESRRFGEELQGVGSVFESYMRGEFGFHLDLWMGSSDGDLASPHCCVLVERHVQIPRKPGHSTIAESPNVESGNDRIGEQGSDRSVFVVVVEPAEAGEGMQRGVVPPSLPGVRLDVFDHSGMDGMDRGQGARRGSSRVRPTVRCVVLEDRELSPLVGLNPPFGQDESPRQMIEGGTQIVYRIPEFERPGGRYGEVPPGNHQLHVLGINVHREAATCGLQNMSAERIRMELCPSQFAGQADEQFAIEGGAHGA